MKIAIPLAVFAFASLLRAQDEPLVFEVLPLPHGSDLISIDPFASLEGPDPPGLKPSEDFPTAGPLIDLRSQLTEDGVELPENAVIAFDESEHVAFVALPKSLIDLLRSNANPAGPGPIRSEIRFTVARLPNELDALNFATWNEPVPAGELRQLLDAPKSEILAILTGFANPHFAPTAALPTANRFEIEIGERGEAGWTRAELRVEPLVWGGAELAFDSKANRTDFLSVRRSAPWGDLPENHGRLLSLIQSESDHFVLAIEPESSPFWPEQMHLDVDLEALREFWRARGPEIEFEVVPAPKVSVWRESDVDEEGFSARIFGFRAWMLRAPALAPQDPFASTPPIPETRPGYRVFLPEFREILGEGRLFDVRPFLESKRISFPPGSLAIANLDEQKLYVRAPDLEAINADLVFSGFGHHGIVESACDFPHRLSFFESDSAAAEATLLTRATVPGRSGQRSRIRHSDPSAGVLEATIDPIVARDGFTVEMNLEIDFEGETALGRPLKIAVHADLTHHTGVEPLKLPLFEARGREFSLWIDPERREVAPYFNWFSLLTPRDSRELSEALAPVADSPELPKREVEKDEGGDLGFDDPVSSDPFIENRPE